MRFLTIYRHRCVVFASLIPTVKSDMENGQKLFLKEIEHSAENWQKKLNLKLGKFAATSLLGQGLCPGIILCLEKARLLKEENLDFYNYEHSRTFPPKNGWTLVMDPRRDIFKDLI